MSRYIDTPTAVYAFLRVWIRTGFSLFHRRIAYRGWENIPADEPVLFAPNHQSAMVDALAVLIHQKRQVVFMARADMFATPTLLKLLRIIKMMPIYRIRDGYSNLGRNEAQMAEAGGVLLRRNMLCLMPEGTQWGKRRLRPLVKGLFRIALTSQEQLGDTATVHIVPTSLDYTEYTHPGADIAIDFGKPIPVSEFMETYAQDPKVAVNQLKDALEARLSAQIQNIHSDEHYEEIRELSYWLTPAWREEKGLPSTAMNDYDARRFLTPLIEEMAEKRPEEFARLLDETAGLRAMPGQLRDNVELLAGGKAPSRLSGLWQALLWLVSLPGRIVDFPVRYAANCLVRKDKDEQMHSTYRISVGTFGLPISYAVYAAVLTPLLGLPFLYWMLMVLMFALAGVLAERIRPYLRAQRPFRVYRSAEGRRQFDRLMSDFKQLKTWKTTIYKA